METSKINEDILEDFFKTMFERQEVWYKRNVLKQKRPWTDDEVLRDYRFTHVYREIDRSSQFLIKNILTNHKLTEKDLVFQIIFYRFYNSPDIFEHEKWGLKLPFYDTYDMEKVYKTTTDYREHVGNPYHSAYVMNNQFSKPPADMDQRPGLFKDYAYCITVFKAVHKIIPKLLLTIKNGKKPEAIIKLLMTLPGVSSFTSYEFYLDFCLVSKYWRQPIMQWNENDFVNVGPGATEGMRRIFPDLPRNEFMVHLKTLFEIAEDFLKGFGEFKYLEWDGAKYVITDQFNFNYHQIEFWLCEYSKYYKFKRGIGRKRKFVPVSKPSY